MYSSQLSNYQILFLYLTLFICWLIFYLYPQRLCDRIGWGIRSQFFPIGFFGFSYQAAHVNSLAWVTLFRDICIPFFSYDVEFCMLFGRHYQAPQFELHTHSRLLVVNINRNSKTPYLETSTRCMMGAALLVHNQSPPSFSHWIFPHHFFFSKYFQNKCITPLMTAWWR